MRIDPLGLADDGDWALDSGKNYGSWGSYWADAGKEFAEDDQWKAGSCQRKEFSNGISNIPIIGDANQAVIAATGHDYISGADVSGVERGFAILGTVVHSSESLQELANLLGKRGSRGGKITLYRGVPKGHERYEDVLNGMAVPLGGHSDTWLHNAGDTLSVFTSWTTDRGEAISKAFGVGNEGVVLKRAFNRSDLVGSPDFHSESEILVIGIVKGAKVTKLLK